MIFKERKWNFVDSWRGKSLKERTKRCRPYIGTRRLLTSPSGTISACLIEVVLRDLTLSVAHVITYSHVFGWQLRRDHHSASSSICPKLATPAIFDVAQEMATASENRPIVLEIIPVQ